MLFCFQVIAQKTINVNEKQKFVIFNNDVDMFFFSLYKVRTPLTDSDIIQTMTILEKKLPLLKCSRYLKQYVGFTNDSSQKIVLVNLIDRKMKKNYLKNWRKDLIVGSGDVFDKFTSLHYINLGTLMVE